MNLAHCHPQISQLHQIRTVFRRQTPLSVKQFQQFSCNAQGTSVSVVQTRRSVCFSAAWSGNCMTQAVMQPFWRRRLVEDARIDRAGRNQLVHCDWACLTKPMAAILRLPVILRVEIKIVEDAGVSAGEIQT